MNVCSIHFHHVHSLLLSGRSSLSEPHKRLFLQMCPIPWDVSHGIPIGMTFLWTSLGTAPSINYRTEKDTDWQKLQWFLVFHIQIWGVEILSLNFESPVTTWPAPQLGIWRAADVALVPDIEGIQNKVIWLWIGTTYSVSVAITCSADLYDISRCKPSRRAPSLK